MRVMNYAGQIKTIQGNVAPIEAEYLVASANSILTNERTPEDTTGNTGVTWDTSLSNVFKANATNAGKWIKLSTATASSSATIDFTGLTSSYVAYMVVWSAVAPETDNAVMYFRTSTDGGSSYDAGVSDYGWAFNGSNHSGTALPGGDNADSEITLDAGTGNAANEISSGTLTIFRPSASAYAQVVWQVSQVTGTPTYVTLSGSGRRLSAADVDAIRFVMSSGNIASGQFDLYGLSA